MEYIIRKANSKEYSNLETFLYEAIFIPEGVQPPPKSIIDQPELQVYIENFGSRRGDICFFAESGNIIIGAAWTRIMNDYGHIDHNTPSLAISLLPEYRGNGIGTSLMRTLLEEVRKNGFSRVSLSVQKMNYAYRLYEKLGFKVNGSTDEEYIMIYHF